MKCCEYIFFSYPWSTCASTKIQRLPIAITFIFKFGNYLCVIVDVNDRFLHPCCFISFHQFCTDMKVYSMYNWLIRLINYTVHASCLNPFLFWYSLIISSSLLRQGYATIIILLCSKNSLYLLLWWVIMVSSDGLLLYI